MRIGASEGGVNRLPEPKYCIIMKRIYAITVENAITEEVHLRAAYVKKLEAIRAYKKFEKMFKDKEEQLGFILACDELRPNENGEFVTVKTLASVGV